jgi:hypothetical protein
MLTRGQRKSRLHDLSGRALTTLPAHQYRRLAVVISCL